MDKRQLQVFAVWAKNNLEEQIKVSLGLIGIKSERDVKKATIQGDFTIIEGDQKSYSKDLKRKRDSIIQHILTDGYDYVIEEFSYTWFNRIVALRFMEVHKYLEHGYKLFPEKDGSIEPEILSKLHFVKDDLELDMDVVHKHKDDSNIEELFRYVLFKQCNALSDILPMLFAKDLDYLEVLLPTKILTGDSIIKRIIQIDETNFQNEVEIMGWLYQFYISENRDKVRKSKKVTKNEIPTLTQIFTPEPVVTFLIENSLGRIWMESNRNSNLSIEFKTLNFDSLEYNDNDFLIEDIKIIDPCVGSGHILLSVFDLLFSMYLEKGYQKSSIPSLIFKNNLFGFDVDKRSVQISSFSLLMKARSKSRRFLVEELIHPNIYEIPDSKSLLVKGYLDKLSELNNEVWFSDYRLSKSEITKLIDIVSSFEFGKEIGSLIKLQRIDYNGLLYKICKMKEMSQVGIFNQSFIMNDLEQISHILRVADFLSNSYDILITNPPYLSTTKLEKKPKEYFYKYYSSSKNDYFSMFMDTDFLTEGGYQAIVNPDSWLYLKTYEKLRHKIMRTSRVITVLDLGMGSFDAVVQTCAHVIRVKTIKYPQLLTEYILGDSKIVKKNEDINSYRKYFRNLMDFDKLPGIPFTFTISDNFIRVFEEGIPIGNIGEVVTGMSTGKNSKYLRFWHEVDIDKINLYQSEIANLDLHIKPWVPYNKGGKARKWYGNNEYVVYWKDNKNFHRSRPTFSNLYLKEGLTWSFVTSGMFSARYYPQGFLWDVAGSPCVISDKNVQFYVLGFLSTTIAGRITKIINPTLNLQVADFQRLPIIMSDVFSEEIIDLTKKCIDISKRDWDSHEMSFDYQNHPLIKYSVSDNNDKKLECIQDIYKENQNQNFKQLKNYEQRLNSIFNEIYGVEKEVDSEVIDKNVTIKRNNLYFDVSTLISHIVGIVFGRFTTKYLLDMNEYEIIREKSYIKNDLFSKTIECISKIFGEANFKENISYISDVLVKNSNESSEERFNRYLRNEFEKAHYSMYKKHPIYWMMSSGKLGAFKCLVYMHKVNEDTLAKINSELFLPELARMKYELEDLEILIRSAENKEKHKLEKRRIELQAMYAEMQEYGLFLDHMANRYISIDLDDGVKVNYDKFQDIEIVTDSGRRIKRDLFVPLK